ncbi:metal-dependent hydrolase [Candidatus Babeliales bacterium]|nr:metal-dependent hydrolase [Candidatus Babeliales bacterium]
MPGYKAHMGAGAVVFAITLVGITHFIMPHPHIEITIQWFFCALIGALFPDVDTKSQGQILFYHSITPLLLFLWWQRQTGIFIWVTFLALLPVLANHRGLFHRPWFIILISGGAAYLCGQSYPYHQKILLIDALFFAIGAFSHIYLDRGVTRLKKRRG